MKTTEPEEIDKTVDVASLNEQLMLGLVRQHELREEAELLNVQLRAEIIARKKAEEALISIEKLASVGRMAAVLAHEINNPLEAVMNVLYLAQTAEGLPDTAREYMITADAELRRIAHISRQTLGFYRELAAPSTFHVATLLNDICDLLKAKVLSTRAIVEQECGGELQMTAYRGELRQVLSNLFRNSLDAIADGGRITLRARLILRHNDGRSCIRITVADNGQGIHKDAKSSIFQPFFTTKGAIGNGLGLWVTQQIIEKHGGAIQVRSHTDGSFQGTTFSIVLPVSDSERKSEP